MGRLLLNQQRDGPFKRLVYLLLHPTIFDDDGDGSGGPAPEGDEPEEVSLGDRCRLSEPIRRRRLPARFANDRFPSSSSTTYRRRRPPPQAAGRSSARLF